MPDRDRQIVDALARAIAFAEDAEKSGQGKESYYRQLIWKAGSEAEYAAFQISITRGFGEYDPPPQGEQQETVAAAAQLLRDGGSHLRVDPRNAYVAVRSAVTILRKIHAATEKPTKDTTKK